MFKYQKNLLLLMRLDKPIGIYLLFFPCAWGVLAATNSYSELIGNIFLILLFLIGSIIMRGAGCIVNDIFDKNLDKSVVRTKDRPIASGRIKVSEAVLFFLFFIRTRIINTAFIKFDFNFYWLDFILFASSLSAFKKSYILATATIGYNF